LDEDFPESEAEKQFQTIVEWGGYAQLSEYDAGEERLYRVEVEKDVEETRD
jgi:NitT/TauT family transport system ATP-binding protein